MGHLVFAKWSKTEALFSEDTPSTKLVEGAELCWNKEVTWPRKTSLSAHVQEGSLGVKIEEVPLHKCVDIPPQASAVEYILG